MIGKIEKILFHNNEMNVNKLNEEFPDLGASIIQDVWDTHKEVHKVREVLAMMTTMDPEPLDRKLEALKDFLHLGRDVIIKLLQENEYDVDRTLIKLVELESERQPPANLERILKELAMFSELGREFIIETLKKNNWDPEKAVIPLVEANSELERKREKEKKLKIEQEKKEKEELLRKKEELERKAKEEAAVREEQLKRLKEEQERKQRETETLKEKLIDDQRKSREEQIRKIREEEQLRKLREEEQLRKLREEEQRRMREEDHIRRLKEEEQLRKLKEAEEERKEQIRKKEEQESRYRDEQQKRFREEEQRKTREEEIQKRMKEEEQFRLVQKLKEAEEERKKLEPVRFSQPPTFDPAPVMINPLEASTTEFVNLIDNSPKSNDIIIKLTAKPEHVEAGETINVIFEVSNPTSQAWVGLYSSSSSQDKDYITYNWISPDTKTGSFSIKAPSKPGSYVFKYFVNRTYLCLASSNGFRVGPAYRLTPTIIGTLEVSINVEQYFGAPSSVAWIGMYEPEKDNKSYHQYNYLAGKKEITFLAPKSGRWEFRVFPSKAYDYTDSISVNL